MTPDYPFTTDGCSGGMSRAWRMCFRSAPPWENCCRVHDAAYWKGGTKAQRRRADRALRFCVNANGHPIWAWLMYLAVRFGGHWILPLPWR